MQITEVFERLNKTVTRESFSQRKGRRLSGKLHCLNFVFPPKTKPLAHSASVAKRRRRPFRCRCLRSILSTVEPRFNEPLYS